MGIGRAWAGLLLGVLLSGCVPEANVRSNEPPPARVVTTPPPANAGFQASELAECRANNRQEHADLVRTYQEADRAGRINPAERRRFGEMVERLRRHEATLRSDGLTLDDCRRLSGYIAQERDVVAGMARHDPGVAQCQRDNQRAHAGVVRSFQEADRAGQISRAERRRFDEIAARMRDHEASLKANGLTLEECQRLGRVIAAEGREVQRMAQQP